MPRRGREPQEAAQAARGSGAGRRWRGRLGAHAGPVPSRPVPACREGPRPGQPPPRSPPRPAMASALLPLLLLLLAGPGPGPGPVAAGSRLAPYDALYADGVRAYFARDWARAAELLQRCVHSYRQLQGARRACGGRCQAEAGFAGAPPGRGPAWEPGFFERALQRADCLQHCLARRLGGPASLHRAGRAVQRDLERREPYNFLQVALFKVRRQPLLGAEPGGSRPLLRLGPGRNFTPGSDWP